MTFLTSGDAEGFGDQSEEAEYCAPDNSVRASGSTILQRCEDRSGQLGEFWPHVPALRSFLSRRLDPADVDDVLQNVFLNLIRRADRSAITHPRCYLFQAARAALVDRHRRQAARRQAFHCELQEADAPVDERSPLRILLARDEVRVAGEILSGLPERTQEIFVAIRLEGLSLKCLANRYNISTSAIEKHVTKATKALSRVRGEGLARRDNSPCSRQPSISHSM